jgi:hypothetical protein
MNLIDIIFAFPSLMPTQDGLYYSVLQDLRLIEGGGKVSRVIGFALTPEEVGQISGGN